MWLVIKKDKIQYMRHEQYTVKIINELVKVINKTAKL